MKPPGPILQLSPIRLSAFFDPHVVTNAIVVMTVMAVNASVVMAVDPMMAMLRPMAGHPDHFPFSVPVTRAMAVIWPVTDFDAQSLRLEGAPESEARRDRHEQQYFLNHINESDREPPRVARGSKIGA
jgi:hypothetical protein